MTIKNMVNGLSRVTGLTGVAFCALSGLWRLLGNYYIAPFEVWTIFFLGVGLMVFACLLKLEVLSD